MLVEHIDPESVQESPERVQGNMRVEELVEEIVEEVGFGRFQTFLFFMSGLGWASDVSELFASGLLISVLEEVFDLQNKKLLGLTGSVPFIGMLVGSIFFGTISDVYGRKPVFFITSTGTFIFGVCSALSRTYLEFLFFRFFVGIFLGGNLPIDFSMFLEWTPLRHRDRATIYLTGWSIVGTLFANSLGYIFLGGKGAGWRWFLVFLSAPSGISMLFRPFFPESPHFLAVSGRYAECADVLRRVAAINSGKNCFSFSYSRLNQDDRSEQESSSASERICRLETFDRYNTNIDLSESWQKSITTLFRKIASIFTFEGQILFVTVLLVCAWGFSGLGFYSFSNWAPRMMKDKHGKDYAFHVLTYSLVFQVFGLLLAVNLSNRKGKAFALCFYFLSSAVAMGLFSTFQSKTGMFIAYSLFNFGAAGMWALLYLVTNLSYSTQVRTTGFGLCSATGRISGIVAPVLAGQLYALFSVGSVLFYAASLLIASVNVCILGSCLRKEI